MIPLRYLSVCSGIEAASVAWEPLGWVPVAFAEIEKFPAAVLKYRWGHVPNLGDMTKINGADFKDKTDVLVGGTPCQSFSVAGLRGGLDDERGNLALEFVRIADESDPAFVVWENVPGIFSDGGNAFGCFLAALAGENAPLLPPGGRWTNAGYVLGPRRTIAWVVRDAQYFGLAQRRKRVFLIGCPRNGADPRKILFEFDGLRRDTPPGRETRQDVAGTLESSLGRSRGAGTPPGAITDVCGTLANISGTRGWSVNAEQAASGRQNLVVTPINTQVGLRHKALGERTGLGVGAPGDPAFTLQRGHSHAVCVAPPLTHKVYGDNASRGDALIPDSYVPEIVNQAISCKWSKGTSGPAGDEHHNLIATALRGEGFDASEDVTHPLGTNQGQEACVFTPMNYAGGNYKNSTVTNTLDAVQGSKQTQLVMAFTERGRKEGRTHSRQILDMKSAVRRLTPTECERLQGFPDGYTAIPWRGKDAEECPDGPRYKALGNSMAVPVMRWIGERIERYLRENGNV